MFPTKVIGVTANYASGSDEAGSVLPDRPSLFMKPSTSVIGPGQAIVLPALSGEVHYGAALAVVIGKVARKVAVEDASSVVLGYTAGNDITAQDLLREERQAARGQEFRLVLPRSGRPSRPNTIPWRTSPSNAA